VVARGECSMNWKVESVDRRERIEMRGFFAIAQRGASYETEVKESDYI
jgi:hypothetical protein